MNLEQLQLLSDDELNRLSAEQVMKFKWHRNFEMWMDDVNSYESWNPTSDMNDAFKLQNALNEEELHDYTLRLMKMVSAFGHITYRDVTNILKSTARQRTIASILAKG